ncbi:unnamed protein product [Rotaria sp. Silwood1]|nr:unnamed protein product [Rotaria sp. Silwood1]CAF3353094.1 unnamed protein product [Rotaria sp. Silwood1]CAF4569921.1 unnamed protein product [Rotaria sp. Silwood1]CAF4604743.1 unnamed protein product [Rotaria sp. Silwood1]
MIRSLIMGNATNHLSLCVSRSSRKTHRERPYVSRPFWPYQYDHHLNVSAQISSNSQIREINPMRLSPTILRQNSPTRPVHIVKKTSYS